LVSSLALKNKDREGDTVAKVYFFNILGNVVGGVVTGFILLSYFGTENTLKLFIIIGMLFGIFTFKGDKLGFRDFLIPIGLIAFLLVFFPTKYEFYKSIFPSQVYEENDEVFFEEGKDGIVALYSNGEKLTNYIGGLPHGGKPGYGYYYETIETYTYSKELDEVLVIGFGAGSFVDALLHLEEVPNITLVELNETLLKNLSKVSSIKDILTHPKVNVVIDDGRRFLYSNQKKFDLIMMDPLRTTTAYSNNLYSKNFFELVKENLSNTGLLMLWAHEHKILPYTVANAFEHVKKYPLFVIAGNTELSRDGEKAQEFLNRFESEFTSHLDKYFLEFNTVDMDGKELLKKYSHLPYNDDWNPIAEYYLRFAILF